MRQTVRRASALFLCMILFLVPAAHAEQKLTAVPILNHAFTLLEEGNPFIERYNRITGMDIRARMTLGMPYLWGGRLESYVFAKEPEYFVYRQGICPIPLSDFIAVGFSSLLTLSILQIENQSLRILSVSLKELLEHRELGTGAGVPLQIDILIDFQSTSEIRRIITYVVVQFIIRVICMG